MSTVIIAIGSDYLQAAHVEWASQRLTRLLDDIRLSRKLWTEAVRHPGRYYQNRLCLGHTTLSAPALVSLLKTIEAETQRTPGRVTIDLDLLQYDSHKYHHQDWPRPYVQQLLTDILSAH